MKARILTGDMRETLKMLPDDSIDAIVTDPPYGLSFMGKGWDHSVPGPDYFKELLRVAKPGAHIVAFSGTRTGHRLACAIEDAGWELRDCLMFLHGQGFPKSHDVSKAIDREAGAEREIVGRRAGGAGNKTGTTVFSDDAYQWSNEVEISAPATPAAQQWQGWGTALKPAWEPIYLARKPLVGTVAANVLEHGTGAINVDGCRIGAAEDKQMPPSRSYKGGKLAGGHDASPLQQVKQDGLGRWPANLCLDESAAAMLGEPSRFFYVAKASRSEREKGLEGFGTSNVNDGRETSIDNPYQRGDTQRKNTHPTVKPIALMQWLIKLITPPGGIVLDPFNGSGSTGCAAVSLGHRYIGCELNPEYVEISMARMRAWALDK